MVKIGFDTSALDPNFKQHAGRGIGRYVDELVRALKSSPDPAFEMTWFDHREVKRNGLVDRLIALSPVGRQTLERQVLYPFRLGQGSTGACDFLHFPAHMDASAWSPIPYALTVLDLIPLVCADLYRAERPDWRFKFARWLENKSIEKAALILAISETTANDLVRVLGISRDSIVITPLGVDQRWHQIVRRQNPGIKSKLGIPASRPVVLYVGGIDPRKNWKGMLETIRLLREKMPQVLLVMAGRIKDDFQYPKLLAELQRLKLENSVLLTGMVSDADLAGLFGESDVFFFPSLYEGFGLPPLEAAAAGLPVVSSNRSSMPEFLGQAALLVNPEDHAACANALQLVLSDPTVAERYSELGKEQARKFTWSRTVQTTRHAYQELASRLGFKVEQAA